MINYQVKAALFPIKRARAYRRAAKKLSFDVKKVRFSVFRPSGPAKARSDAGTAFSGITRAV
jgi:hypothetical protein